MLAAACLDPTGAQDVGGEHLWVFHVSGGRYADHVQLVAIGDRADAAGRRRFRAIPSRAWDGSPTNDFAHFEALATDSAGRQWRLEGAGAPALQLEFQTTADTASGQLTIPGVATYAVFGVRFDSSVIGLLAPRLAPLGGDSTPAVLIRLDDAPASDVDFLERLSTRGLPAEIAVPTRVVGLPGRLTWNELRRWRGRGMGIAMHSREHRRTSADAQYFVAEVVGGFADLAAQGLATRVFVEPGTWGGAILFNAPEKLHTWRGALLRSFATVSECYAYPRAVSFVPADSFALGLSHLTISDGLTAPQIRVWWQGALQAHRATVFLVHTARLKSPGQLDWFLDLVADARAAGKIRVVADAEQLFFPGRSGPHAVDRQRPVQQAQRAQRLTPPGGPVERFDLLAFRGRVRWRPAPQELFDRARQLLGALRELIRFGPLPLFRPSRLAAPSHDSQPSKKATGCANWLVRRCATGRGSAISHSDGPDPYV